MRRYDEYISWDPNCSWYMYIHCCSRQQLLETRGQLFERGLGRNFAPTLQFSRMYIGRHKNWFNKWTQMLRSFSLRLNELFCIFCYVQVLAQWVFTPITRTPNPNPSLHTYVVLPSLQISGQPTYLRSRVSSMLGSEYVVVVIFLNVIICWRIKRIGEINYNFLKVRT
jgi:hypothetical protein